MEKSGLKIELLVPSEIDKKLQEGDYSRQGSIIRDKSGRIVCNLSSLDVDETHYFSRNIFVNFNQYCIFSASTIPEKLTKDLQGHGASLNTIELRLKNQIIASISIFRDLFSALIEKSDLTDQKQTFKSGVEAAALIAVNMQDFIEKYIDSTVIYEKNKHYYNNAPLYSEIRSNRYITASKTEFSCLRKSDAFYFIYNFLDIINSINIISLFYDKKLYSRYEENIYQIKSIMMALLSRLVNGLVGEGTIYAMYYTNHHASEKRIDIGRILKFDDSHTLDDVVLKSNPALEKPVYWDNNRINSIIAVIEILEEIESLLLRSKNIEPPTLFNFIEDCNLERLIFPK